MEICTASVEDARIAEAAGAHRIELNTALPLGGLTPTPGMVRNTLQQVSIPVIAMTRPRESGFCYSSAEFQVMIQDATAMLEWGVSGIAFGVITENGSVDEQRCRQMVQVVGPGRDSVFHRAFDLIEDQGEALETLIRCGVTRVMTSGGKPTAREGQSRIADLVARAAGRIEILAAGGIRSDHVTPLIQQTGVTQVHAGLGEPVLDRSWDSGAEVSFYGKLPENPAQFRQSSRQAIQEMARLLETGQNRLSGS